MSGDRNQLGRVSHIAPYVGGIRRGLDLFFARERDRRIGRFSLALRYLFATTLALSAMCMPLFSSPAAAITAPPGAPSEVIASTGDGELVVSWVTPPDNDAPLIVYKVTPMIGGVPGATVNVQASTAGDTPGYLNYYTLSGLRNGTTYTVSVSASNLEGTGPSSTSNAAAPGPVPSQTTVEENPGIASAQLFWNAPQDNGTPISSYVVTPYEGVNAESAIDVPASAVAKYTDGHGYPLDEFTVGDLSNGTTYTFEVAAVNVTGVGPPSGRVNQPVTPDTSSAPFAVTQLTATTSGTVVTVHWTVPSNNGAPITEFLIEDSFVGPTATIPVGPIGSPTDSSPGAQDSAVATDSLDYGVGSFTVVAVNSAGDGPPEVYTNLVFPPLGLNPSPANFGSLAVGASETLGVQVGNSGSGPDVVSQFSLGGADANEFTVQSDCSASLTPGSACILNVDFIPTDLGPAFATLTVTDSRGNSSTTDLEGTGAEGYLEAGATGVLHPFGNLPSLDGGNSQPLNAPIVAVVLTDADHGEWLAAADGGVFSYGDAAFYGSAGGIHLNAPVVGMAATPDGGGYWLVASDGGVFSYGDGAFYGSAGGIHLNAPIVGMAATPDGGGYWLVASDGGVFSYGDAAFHGSASGIHLYAPIVGMAATPDGGGYWLAASDGGVFSYGNAQFEGSWFPLAGSSVVGISA